MQYPWINYVYNYDNHNFLKEFQGDLKNTKLMKNWGVSRRGKKEENQGVWSSCDNPVIGTNFVY